VFLGEFVSFKNPKGHTVTRTQQGQSSLFLLKNIFSFAKNPVKNAVI
jgi:hypothetical protein